MVLLCQDRYGITTIQEWATLKQKLTLALSDDVVEIIRQAGPRRMGQLVDALVRASVHPEPGKGILERMAEDLAELVEQKGRE